MHGSLGDKPEVVLGDGDAVGVEGFDHFPGGQILPHLVEEDGAGSPVPDDLEQELVGNLVGVLLLTGDEEDRVGEEVEVLGEPPVVGLDTVKVRSVDEDEVRILFPFVLDDKKAARSALRRD